MLIKKWMPAIGLIIISGLYLYRPQRLGDILVWISIGVLAIIPISLLVLYLSYIYYKTKEAKEEGGWLIAIITFIGLILFFALVLLMGSNSDKSILP